MFFGRSTGTLQDVGEELAEPIVGGHSAVDAHAGGDRSRSRWPSLRAGRATDRRPLRARRGRGARRWHRASGRRWRRAHPDPNAARRARRMPGPCRCHDCRARSVARRSVSAASSNHTEPVAEPFDGGAGDEDRSFERVGRAALQPVGGRRQQPVMRSHRRRSPVFTSMKQPVP